MQSFPETVSLGYDRKYVVNVFVFGIEPGCFCMTYSRMDIKMTRY